MVVTTEKEKTPTKKEAKILMREFKKAHEEQSISHSGHFPPSWSKDAEVIRGYWYWKGYKVADLFNIIKAK